VSNSPGVVVFAVGLVDFTLNLPKGRVKVFGKIYFGGDLGKLEN